MINDERKRQEEAVKKELKAAYWEAAKAAGFRVKSWDAIRQMDGSQQSMHLSLNPLRPVYRLYLRVRLDRQTDEGNEVLKKWDIQTNVERPVERSLGNDEVLTLRAAMNAGIAAPDIDRGEVLKRCLNLGLPWFDEISSFEAIERCTRDNDYRIRMGTVTRYFYDDFIPD